MLQLDAVRILRKAEERSPVMVVAGLRKVSAHMRQQAAMYELAIEIRAEIGVGHAENQRSGVQEDNQAPRL